MAGNLQSDIRDLERRMNKALDGFKKGPRKRILRRAARVVVLEVRKTRAFRDQTGTLRRSLNRITGLRKSQDEFVGPRKEGFYAGFVFGGRPNFRRAVLDPAARASRGKVITTIETESRREIQRQAAKNNLN